LGHVFDGAGRPRTADIGAVSLMRAARDTRQVRRDLGAPAV